MKWYLVTVICLLIGIAASAEADSNSHRTYGDCGRISSAGSLMAPSVVAVHVDGDHMYAARQDGYVDAIDRVSGNVQWTYPSNYFPGEPIRDMVADGERVYIAYADTENNAADQVIAIDAKTGQDVWRSTAWGNGRDTFRLGQDETYLYLGLDGGSIAKLYKHSGEAVKLADGRIVMFNPSLFAQTPDPNGIYAMDVVGDRIIAARNFGNATADRAVLLNHENNTLLIINKNSLQPFQGVELQPGEAPGEYRLRDDDGPRQWGVFGLYGDAGTGEVYLSASEWAFWFTDPSGTHIHGDRVRFGKIPLSDGGAELLADATTSIGQGQLSPPIISGSQIKGTPGASGGLIAVTTTTTQTAGGYVVSIDKDSLAATEVGSVGNGDIRSVAIDAADNDVVVHGHQCVAAVGKHAGLIAEQDITQPGSVTLLSPTGGEANQGTLRVDLRIQAAELNNPRIEFLVSSVGGRCEDGSSCYKRLADLGGTGPISVESEDRQARIDGVQVPLPEGAEYRLKVRLLDGGSIVYEDFAEGTFTIDRSRPEILGVSPSSQSTISETRPVLKVIVRDQWTAIDAGRTHITINGKSHGGLQFDANGFEMDLEAAQVSLREGFNDLAVQVTDRAGNIARLDGWEILVDASVVPPAFLPESGGWVRDERPTLTAQFIEPVTLVQSALNGVDVTDQVAVPPISSGEGTRLIFRPEGVLSTGLVHVWEVTVRDAAGNEAGPFSRVFRVDSTPPTIGQVHPSPNQVINDPVPAIVFQPADAGSGLDLASMGVFVDGEDVSGDVESLADRFVYRPDPLDHGEHTVTVSVLDQAGNRAARTWSFDLDLFSPQVDVDVQMPSGQTAVKRGDDVTFRIHVKDDGLIRAVRMDARGLNANATTAQLIPSVAGLPGAYEVTVRVDQVRTQPVTVTVTAEDATGQIGFREVSVLVDNAPPLTRMLDLPSDVGASFDLRWTNDPDDEQVGGSGVAYYIVERRIDNGEWRVVLPRVTTERVEMELLDSPFARLQFRVRAVDNAGNVQLAPSNVVETIARGDPFSDTRFPAVVAIGKMATFSAQPLQEVPLEGSQVYMRFSASDGSTEDVTLGRFGRLYTLDWNGTDLHPGTYNLQFIFRDTTGIELKGPSYTVQAVPYDPSTELSSVDDGRDVPWPSWPLWLLPLAAAVARRGVD